MILFCILCSLLRSFCILIMRQEAVIVGGCTYEQRADGLRCKYCGHYPT